MRAFRLAPITAETLIVCVAVYGSCLLQAASHHERFVDVQREWSAIQNRDLSEIHDGVRRSKHPELHGPFDVWNGEWWRIPVTVFHHGDLLSLVLSVGATWYLGSRLEQRWGSFAMSVFLVPAICVPVLAELCFGRAFIGLSGLACAMLGALVVLRRFDERVACHFSEEAAGIGVVLIVVGWLASQLDMVSLPNAAHLSGFAYGAAVAGISSGALRHVTFLRVSVILLHLWMVPALFLVCHPFWIGRYHWYQAVVARNQNRAERNLEKAVRCDGTLIGAWLRWSQLAEEGGDQSEAWRRLVNGLSINPASAPLIDSTRRLWRHLDLRQRREAELVLEEYFQKRAAIWLNQIRTGVAPTTERDEETTIEREIEEAGQFSLDQKVELPTLESLNDPANRQNPRIPIDGNDASEGKSL